MLYDILDLTSAGMTTPLLSDRSSRRNNVGKVNARESRRSLSDQPSVVRCCPSTLLGVLSLSKETLDVERSMLTPLQRDPNLHHHPLAASC